MTATTAEERFTSLERQVPFDDYNFQHFSAKYIIRDVRRTLNKAGVNPGEIAPDFELPIATGGSLRLSELRGKPVLLRFGSWT
jgi:hypothetical protein